MYHVVIGRFQLNELHAAHLQLLDAVRSRGGRMLVLLGCPTTPANMKDPIDYALRERVIRALVPENTIILPLVDRRTDEEWSKAVDQLIELNFGYHNKATLYGGRDSFIGKYSGRHKTEPLSFGLDGVSATELRRRIAENPKTSPDFLAGVIYAHQTAPPRIDTTVDVTLVKGDRALMVLRHSEGKYRFAGGFVNFGDETLETAVRRELLEESGLTIEGGLEYVGSTSVDDWRTRGLSDRKILTTLWKAPYAFGNPARGNNDDVDLAEWIDLTTDPLDIMPEHRPLWAMLLRTFGVVAL